MNDGTWQTGASVTTPSLHYDTRASEMGDFISSTTDPTYLHKMNRRNSGSSRLSFRFIPLALLPLVAFQSVLFAGMSPLCVCTRSERMTITPK